MPAALRTCCLLAFCGWLEVAHAAPPDTPARPNVLFILADDLGFSDLGCYGGEIETPSVDRLAAGGLRFTQFYNTARCWPTRAALLTGYYAQQVRRDAISGTDFGARGQRPAWAPLLPQLLKPLGYRAYHSGKWHLDGTTAAGGFDHAYVIDDHNRFFAPRQHSEDDRPLPPVDAGSGFYLTTAIADHALKCLREHAANHAGEPFFHYVAFTAPHFPLHARQEEIDHYRDRYRQGWNAIAQARGRRLRDGGIVAHDPPDMERGLGPPYAFEGLLEKLGPGEVLRPLPWDELSAVQRGYQIEKMAIHAAMIHRMDVEIGRLIDQLAAMGQLDNTVVMFASDNGASAEVMIRGDGHDPRAAPGAAGSYLCLGPGWSSAANTPFRRHKTWVHEGGIATPLVVHWPAGIDEAGALRNHVAHVIDLVPTVLDLAGGERPTTWQARAVPPAPGKSLVPAFSDRDSAGHDELWWFHDGHRALRQGNWKLVGDGADDAWELYDLAEDRGESRNLAGEHPQLVRRLARAWSDRLTQFRTLATDDPAPPPQQP